MSYEFSGEDITDNVPGAREAGILIDLTQDGDASDYNPRLEGDNAVIVAPRFFGLGLDERNKFGAWRNLEKGQRDRDDYGRFYWYNEDFDWSDDWFETASRLRTMHRCEVFVVRANGYGLIVTDGEQGYACGVIYATPAMMRAWSGEPKCTGAVRRQARAQMLAELDLYSKWARGEVYMLSYLDAVTGETLDACGGFIGHDYASTDAAIEGAAYWIGLYAQRATLITQPWAGLDCPDLIGGVAA